MPRAFSDATEVPARLAHCKWAPRLAFTLEVDGATSKVSAQLGTGFTGMSMQRTPACVSRASHATVPWQRARRE